EAFPKSSRAPDIGGKNANALRHNGLVVAAKRGPLLRLRTAMEAEHVGRRPILVLRAIEPAAELESVLRRKGHKFRTDQRVEVDSRMRTESKMMKLFGVQVQSPDI